MGKYDVPWQLSGHKKEPILRFDVEVDYKEHHFIAPDAEGQQDSNITGTLKLTVLRPVTLKRILLAYGVRFRARSPLQLGAKLEQGKIPHLDQQQTLSAVPQSYEPGNYAFPFEFAEKVDTEANVFSEMQKKEEKPSAGRICIYRYMTGTAECTDGQSIVQDIGMFNREDWIEAPIRITTVSSADLSRPTPVYESSVESHSSAFGAFKLSISSARLLLGSMIEFCLFVPAPPSDMPIPEIRVYVKQQVQWTSPTDPSLDWSDTSRFLMYDSTQDPKSRSKTLQKDKSFRFAALARLTKDGQGLAQSTHEKSNGAASFTHAFEIQFTASAEQASGRRRMVTVNRPIFIAYCELIPEAVDLPLYEQAAPKLPEQAEAQPDRPKDPWPCCCGYSWEQLEKLHRQVVAPLDVDPPVVAQTSSELAKPPITSGSA